MGGLSQTALAGALQDITHNFDANILVIGAVGFDNDEHPDEITFPSAQELVVHHLIGGSRVVHPMGAQPGPVEFEGHLWEDRVQNRVQTLALYLNAGQEIPIQWEWETYYGVLKQFDVTYYAPWYAKYKIAIEITRDTNGRYTNNTATSLDQQIYDLVSIAGNAAADASDVDPVATGVQTAVQNVGATIQRLGPVSQNAGNVAGILTAVNAAITIAQVYTNRLSGTNLQQQANMQGVLTSLSLIAANVQVGQSVQTIQVDGGIRLDDIAAKYYGDPSLAGQLAAANNLTSMRLPMGQSVVLSLPKLTSTNPLVAP